jgi:RNA polymerase sigma-70 factor (ECF subfamily)
VKNEMAKINLRDIFPFYTTDCFVDVPDDEKEAFTECLTKTIADVFVEFQRAESAYQRKQSKYKAYYSLDQNDGVENTIISVIGKSSSSNVLEEYIDKMMKQQLYAAINSLPEKQSRRIYAHYFLNMSKSDIAKAESVHESSVRESIDKGLENIKKYFEKFL